MRFKDDNFTIDIYVYILYTIYSIYSSYFKPNTIFYGRNHK